MEKTLIIILILAVINEWRKWPIKTIKSESSDFPAELRQIKQAPKKMFYRGEWQPKLLERTISIVGSRRMTQYGKNVVEMVMLPLVQKSTTVISGFMYGVDAEAHEQALAMGGQTIAILASGLDYPTPADHDRLYYKILERGGLVMSEYEPNFRATLWSFPQRNRIVSGLATEGVIVVEAGIDSGSLVTARFAREQRKKLWAVPGPITSAVSRGCNELIKNGQAKALLSADDLLGSCQREKQLEIPGWSKTDMYIFELLEDSPLTIDVLSLKLHKEVAEVNYLVSILELNGMIEESNGVLYKKTIRRETG
ncbi:DNA-processing protein DprA [Patescibacteria group bacterium]|nr:DNA-processing protein DprA [Patescibacteria group bacterium]